MPQVKCKHSSGCSIQPSFGDPKDCKVMFCKKHAPAHFKDVKTPKCFELNCPIQPSFADPSGKLKERYCVSHKPDGFIYVLRKTCSDKDCKTKPNFGYPGGEALFCKFHSPIDTVDVLHPTCKYEDCKTRPNYGDPSTLVIEFCRRHATEGYKNVVSKTCLHCLKNPTYGVASNRIAIYCRKHCPNDVTFIDVKSDRCSFEGGCKKISTFGDPLSTSYHRLKYCRDHRPEGFEPKTSRKCIISDCIVSPSYFEPFNIKLRYCLKHRTPTSVPKYSVKTCSTSRCKNVPTHGDKGRKPIVCSDHADIAIHIDLIADSKCSETGCNVDFDYISSKTKYCMEHCPLDASKMETLKRICQICDQSEKSPYICKACNIIKNKKEWSVVQFLRRNVKTSFSHDERLYGMCGNRRPDIHYKLSLFDVIIEVDEQQHYRLTPECELARMSDIVGHIGGKPIVFIRYNPDVFRHSGKVVKVTQADRLSLLLSTVKNQLSITEPESFSIKVIKLFFDSDESSSYSIAEDITSKVCIV